MPRRVFRLFVPAILAAVVPCAAQTAPPSTPPASAAPPDQAALLKSTEAFVRNLYAWGPDFKVDLGPISQSESPEFYTVPVHVVLKGQGDAATFYVGKDGKTFLRGEMYDMSADPFADARAKIHVDNNPSKGPANAGVILVEFSDFQCPHCRQLYQNLKLIEPHYPQVRFVFKDFPITQIHPWANTAALGARCAFMQRPDSFWQLHDAIFENQELISAANVWDKVVEFARGASLDVDALKSCMASSDAQKAVQANIADGQSVNVNSTPTVFVNGRPAVSGDKDTVRQYIDYELRAQRASPALRAPGSPAPHP